MRLVLQGIIVGAASLTIGEASEWLATLIVWWRT